LSREILSGGPIITTDPFCRVNISLSTRKIYFLHVPYGPLLDLYFRAPFCTAEGFSPFFLLPRHFARFVYLSSLFFSGGLCRVTFYRLGLSYALFLLPRKVFNICRAT
jgi:hypothetical protein